MNYKNVNLNVIKFCKIELRSVISEIIIMKIWVDRGLEPLTFCLIHRCLTVKPVLPTTRTLTFSVLFINDTTHANCE